MMYKVILNGPKYFHGTMAYKVIRATKQFFDRNPSGRILNRFSADIGCIDSKLFKAYIYCLDLIVR